MEIVKISMLGISGVLLGFLLKGIRPEYGFYISFCVGIFILFFAVAKLSILYDSLREIQSYLPIEKDYMTAILKMLGISYLAQFSGGICKDAGYGNIAGQIELFARLAIMTVSMPILLAILETIHEFLA
jgi:stage III sporulation protein AD